MMVTHTDTHSSTGSPGSAGIDAKLLQPTRPPAYCPPEVPEGLEVICNSSSGATNAQCWQNAGSTWDFGVDSEDRGIGERKKDKPVSLGADPWSSV